MPVVTHRCVDSEQAHQRLDNFLLRELKGVPRGHVYRLLRTGQVRVNGKRVKAEYRLQTGDDLRLPPVRQADRELPRAPGSRQLERLRAAILHEDAELLIINKPAGMPVHGGSGVSFGVIEMLRRLRPEEHALDLVHRLDRDTSGCLVVARKRSALRALHAAIRAGEVEKHYCALLAGVWRGGPREVTLALQKNVLQSGERRVRVATGGKPSQTLFSPLQHYADASLMDVLIRSGRTHQIRVHAAALHHPVLGDDKYGDRDANRRLRAHGLTRMFLHAARIAFVHPATGKRLEVSAPLEEALEVVLGRLPR
ncbi:MAG: RluA family pseudouridine synthase [Gammaproteobacteria bacterium]